MFRTLSFTTGDYEKRKVFLPDKEYGLALDALVKACADVLVTREDRGELEILSGRRRVHPQPDWWFVGGRMRPGESPAQSAARNVKREIDLDLSPSRFHVVGVYSLIWRMRAQAPATNGTCDLSAVFTIELSKAEASSLDFTKSFDKEEYRDAKWLTPATILSHDFHPAYQQAVRDLMGYRAYRKLTSVANNPLSPASLVAAAARTLLSWNDHSPPTFNDLYVIYDEQNQKYVFKHPNNSKTSSVLPRPYKQLPRLAERDLKKQGAIAKRLPTIRFVFDVLAGPLLGAILGIALYQRSLHSRRA